jgi:NADP-dependent 3-hydroxy acid dehydrogenase YdfG
LEFAKQLLSKTPAKIIGLCRSIPKSTELTNLKQLYNERLVLLEVDLADNKSIESVCTKIKSITNKVDLLLNVAGILSKGTEFMPERSLEGINYDWLKESIDVSSMN